MTKSKTKKLGKVTKKLRGKKKPNPKKKVSPWLVGGITASIFFAFLLPYLTLGGGSEIGERAPSLSYNFCLDISHHNHPDIVWDSLAVIIDDQGRTRRDIEDGRRIRKVSSVVMKATEGVSMKDRRFKRFWEEAGETSITRGAYHFFRTSAGAARQAENFINTVGTLRHSDMPPVLDLEVMHKGCTKKQLNDSALVWLSMIEKHYGRKPVVYTPDSYARDILSDDIKERYPIWVAHYGVEMPWYGDWKMWQFTDRAVVHGIRGRVDLSVVKD